MAAAGDAYARAAQSRLVQIRKALREDRVVFEKATRKLTLDLASSRVGAEIAAAEHQSSLAFFLSKVDATVDLAAAEFVDDVAVLMDAEVTKGANPGDGGATDRFVEGVRGELTRLRARTQARARSFARAFVKYGRGNTSMNTVLPSWSFDLPAAPAPGGPIASEDAPLELRLITAARLPDGSLVVTAAGNADRSYGGKFDLRIRSSLTEELIGDPLSEGGLTVGATGYWSVATELGDPFRGDVPQPGNRVLHFGVEPSPDIPPAGVQPQRLLRAAVFLLP
jgi:hypothetical protein